MAETKIPDIVETLYSLLQSNWTSGNTDSRTPNILRRQHLKPGEYTSDDEIIIYDKATVGPNVGIMKIHRTTEDNASVEVRTSRGPRQAKRMRAEVERIINGNPCPTSYVEWNTSSENTAASYDYDLIEMSGTNRPWVHDENTRDVIEVKAWVYYQVNFT